MASQYIGGDLSQSEREARYLRMFWTLPVDHAHWPYQCRCGTYGMVTYRGRNYCPRCGHRYTQRGLDTIRGFHNKPCPASCSDGTCPCRMDADRAENVLVQDRVAQCPVTAR